MELLPYFKILVLGFIFIRYGSNKSDCHMRRRHALGG